MDISLSKDQLLKNRRMNGECIKEIEVKSKLASLLITSKHNTYHGHAKDSKEHTGVSKKRI